MTQQKLAATLIAAAALFGLSTVAAFAMGTTPKQCDRQCLDSVVDTYIAALVAHDPSKAPLDAGIKTVENLKAIKPGDGLWKTAGTAPTTFKIYVPDPTTHEVGFMGIMQENGKPIQVALRLKVVGGKITEAEHLIARDLRDTSLANLQSPRPGLLTTLPAGEREPHDELIKIGASYYDALDGNNGALAPFAEDCERHENGMITATNKPLDPNAPPAPIGNGTVFNYLGHIGCAKQLDTQSMSYIDTIENRRVFAADIETGLVMGFSHFHHSMKNKTEKLIGVPGVTEIPMNFDPFDLPAAHIYKVSGGKIHEIEAMGFVAPYMSPTGW